MVEDFRYPRTVLLSLASCVRACCHFSRFWLFVTPWTVDCQAPLSMEFSRQEYWSGLPCPPPGDLLTQDRTCISCISCIAGRFFTPWSTGEALSSSLNSTIWHLCWEAFVGAFPGNNFLLVCWLQWQIDGETMKKVEDFILGGSKITADGDYSHEIKRCLLLGRKVMTNLASILKSKDIILPRKVCLVKAMVFPVVIYGC